MKISKVRVAIYNAASSKEVNDFQVSLLMQRADEKKEWWEFDAERDLYTDIGYSNRHLAGRPALQTLLEMVKAGKYELIVIKNIVNLGRNLKEVYNLVSDLFEKGVEICFLDNGLSSGEMICDLPKFFASLISFDKIAGENFVFGFIYKKFTDSYKLDTDSFPFIMEMFMGIMEGKTAEQIAFELSLSCVINPEGSEGWTADMVEKVLRNPIYREDYSDEKGIVGFLDAEFWDLVQARLNDNEN